MNDLFGRMEWYKSNEVAFYLWRNLIENPLFRYLGSINNI